jgi:hypothetical protein
MQSGKGVGVSSKVGGPGMTGTDACMTGASVRMTGGGRRMTIFFAKRVNGGVRGHLVYVGGGEGVSRER